MIRRYLLLFLLPVLLYSCEKPESALVLPPPTGASHALLELGAAYEQQIYFNFASGKGVFTSDPTAWDLAFETGEGQRHIFINGGQKVYIHNTRKTEMSAVTTRPAGLSADGTGWTHDMPCGLSDSTAIGDWFNADGSSKGEVYVMQLQFDETTKTQDLVKLRILSLKDDVYTIEWAPLDAAGPAKQVSVAKDAKASFSYLSLKKGQAFLEPKPEDWDIVFTRYRHIYRDYVYGENQKIPIFPYEVTGVLLNPARTRAVADSLTGFENITREFAATKTPSAFRDAIGFKWKDYTDGRYIVKRRNCFIVWTQRGEVYKLHFLDYYHNGHKGSPSFEYERLQ